MGEAFVWGVVAGSSLVLGGVIALQAPITRRHVGLIMAFGAGVLISAVAYELVHEAFETSAGDGEVALGLLAGSAFSSPPRCSSTASPTVGTRAQVARAQRAPIGPMRPMRSIRHRPAKLTYNLRREQGSGAAAPG
jgi:hypothetical protein